MLVRLLLMHVLVLLVRHVIGAAGFTVWYNAQHTAVRYSKSHRLGSVARYYADAVLFFQYVLL